MLWLSFLIWCVDGLLVGHSVAFALERGWHTDCMFDDVPAGIVASAHFMVSANDGGNQLDISTLLG